MKILIISTNTIPASPLGTCLSGWGGLLAGHEVQIFERLFVGNLSEELTDRLKEFRPDVVGISIRLVFDDRIDGEYPLGTRHTDLRPSVKEITDIVRQSSSARIVLGGPGFSYYARDWLEYLGLDYGIRCEGEEAFPLYLKLLSDGGDASSVRAGVFKRGGRFILCPQSQFKI